MSLQKVSEDALVKDAEDVKILGSTDGGTTWVPLKVAFDGSIVVVAAAVGFTIPENDYFAVTYPTSVQEVYTFKLGGVGGATVATVTLNYTNDTKDFLLNGALT